MVSHSLLCGSHRVTSHVRRSRFITHAVSLFGLRLRRQTARWHEGRLPHKAMGSRYRAMQRPFTRLLGTTITLLTVAAWLLAANHCVVGCLASPLNVEAESHEHCGGSSETPAGKEQSGDCDNFNCCKSLSAPASFAKKLVGYDKAFYTLKDYVVSEIVFADEQHDASISELDTGPPPGPCFAESVLQRSLLAHAPPSLS